MYKDMPVIMSTFALLISMKTSCDANHKALIKETQKTHSALKKLIAENTKTQESIKQKEAALAKEYAVAEGELIELNPESYDWKQAIESLKYVMKDKNCSNLQCMYDLASRKGADTISMGSETVYSQFYLCHEDKCALYLIDDEKSSYEEWLRIAIDRTDLAVGQINLGRYEFSLVHRDKGETGHASITRISTYIDFPIK